MFTSTTPTMASLRSRHYQIRTRHNRWDDRVRVKKGESRVTRVPAPGCTKTFEQARRDLMYRNY